MSGLFTEPIRKKGSPSRKVILLIIIISITVLGIRAYLNHLKKTDDKKTTTSEVKKANVITDNANQEMVNHEAGSNEVNNNISSSKSQEEITSSTTNSIKKQQNSTQGSYISEKHTSPNDSVNYTVPMKSNSNSTNIYQESGNHVRKYDHSRLIESSIRKEKKLPPNQIDKNSQTFQHLKQVTSTGNKLEYDKETSPSIPITRSSASSKKEAKIQVPKPKKESIVDINVDIFDSKKNIVKKSPGKKKKAKKRKPVKTKTEKIAVKKEEKPKKKAEKKTYINMGLKKSKKVTADKFINLISKEESKMVNKKLD